MNDIEFKFAVRSEPAGSLKYNDNTSQLGDGYSVSSPNGINTETQSWAISITSPMQACGAIGKGQAPLALDYLRATKRRAESFPWTSPLGELIRVEAGNLTYKRSGSTLTVSTTFTQVYR